MMKQLFMLGIVFVLLFTVACDTTQNEESAQTTAETSESTLENGSYDAEINGRMVHYEVHGTGPACIVLTNSWGFDSVGVRAVFEPLESMLTMVYFDPRGMGKSGPANDPADMSMAAVREDAHELMHHLGLVSAVYAGWSNGASNLYMYAAEYPEDVKAALILHGTSYVTMERFQEIAQNYPELMQANQQLTAELANEEIPLEEKSARLKEFSLARFFPAMTADPEATSETLPAIFADASFSWNHNNYAMQEIFAFDAREQLGQITAPCLVIAGAHDMMSIDLVQEAADGINNATFVVFENSGHFASLEETERFLKVVKEFLASVE